MLWPTGPVTTELSHRAPDQFLYSKSAILDLVRSRWITAGSQFLTEQRNRRSVVVSDVSRSELDSAPIGGCAEASRRRRKGQDREALRSEIHTCVDASRSIVGRRAQCADDAQ